MPIPYLPHLYVEGTDDVSVISALLSRHGVETKRGAEHLYIKPCGSDEEVLSTMRDAIRANTERPVGFVIDIDDAIANRWDAVCDRLRQAGLSPPESCPPDGYVGKISDYPCSCGVWLMPDCASDGKNLEHLVATLIPEGDVLWPFAQESTEQARIKADEASCPRFRDVDLLKAKVHAWLAWKDEPGRPLGAAITSKVLGADSEVAHRFLRWLERLFGLGITGI